MDKRRRQLISQFKATIKPFAEVDSLSEDALKTIGFRFTHIGLSLSAEGWLWLSVDWSAHVDHVYKVKYPVHDSTGYGAGLGRGFLDANTVSLEFPEVAAPYYSPGPSPFEVCPYADTHKAGIDVGIGLLDSRRRGQRNATAEAFPQLPFQYSHHVNTKYGVCVHFKPRDWGSGDYTPIHSWYARRHG